jgi:hypothetical protein
MREVTLPTGPVSHPHRRRSIALIAVWLVALQAFVAGFAIARSAAMLTVDPFHAGICHGTGGSTPAESPAGGPDKIWHICCAYCTAAGSPTIAPGTLALAEMQPGRDLEPFAYLPFSVSVSRGAVRAGPSQAPPTLA